MRIPSSKCALLPGIGLILCLSAATAQAQHIPPYHGPGAEGQHHGHRPELGTGATFGNPGGHYIGGPTRYGPAAPSYWTYNRFSNIGFGGLNWFYGPLGGYTPYVTPYGYTTYGYPNFGPYYSYVPLAPVIRQTRPYWIGGDPFDNVAVQGANGRNNAPAAAKQIPAQPPQDNVAIIPKVTSNDAVRRSIHLTALGDEYFAKQNYVQAYLRYKEALGVAPTRVEARFRLAMAMAASTNYAQAVDEMKRGMRMDPNWPRTGPTLDELFGADSILSKNALLHKVAAWVREDIRDPDRLFLMGVLLHFNDDPDKSRAFFEAASALSPVPAYAEAFLDAEGAAGAANVDPPRPGPVDGPVGGPMGQPRVDPVRRQGPNIPGINNPPNEPDPVFRGKAPEEPRPRPLALRKSDLRERA